jgi:hypothetical protein
MGFVKPETAGQADQALVIRQAKPLARSAKMTHPPFDYIFVFFMLIYAYFVLL